MSTPVYDLPVDIAWGAPDAPVPDWRADGALADEPDVDDTVLAVTPPDVVATLGFDPLDEDDDVVEKGDLLGHLF